MAKKCELRIETGDVGQSARALIDPMEHGLGMFREEYFESVVCARVFFFSSPGKLLYFCTLLFVTRKRKRQKERKRGKAMRGVFPKSTMRERERERGRVVLLKIEFSYQNHKSLASFMLLRRP